MAWELQDVTMSQGGPMNIGLEMLLQKVRFNSYVARLVQSV
jgi:hypothetical protein